MVSADFQPSDHDVLITLSANFTSFTQRYQRDIDDIKNGTAAKLADHESRLHKQEVITNEVKPIETVKEFRALQLEWSNFKTSAQVTKYFVGLVTAVFGGTITLVGQWLIQNFFFK